MDTGQRSLVRDTTVLMRRSLSPCSVSGCPTLTMKHKCDKHSREADRKRGTATERGYGKQWRQTRKVFLDRYPCCQHTDGCINQATDVHHVDGLGPKGPLGHDEGNLMAFCHSHHSQITSQEQPGGWHRRD